MTEVSYLHPDDSTRVRWLLMRTGLTTPAAAAEIGVDEGTLEAYLAGAPVPRTVVLALERVVDLARMIA